jgi:hypothetical protein
LQYLQQPGFQNPNISILGRCVAIKNLKYIKFFL